MELDTKAKLVFLIFGVALPLVLIAVEATLQLGLFPAILGSIILSGVLLLIVEGIIR
ncbi:MAG: hypothetical protein AB1665_09060 [Candidatus Thermoplasmatota archaeon]